LTHWRQTARETAVEAIRGASTLAGVRVYAERLARLDVRRETFPIVCVYTRKDGLTRRGGPGSSWTGSGALIVACVATGVATDTLTAEEVAARNLDDLCEQIESILVGDGVWEAGSGVKVSSIDTEIAELEGEKPLISAKMTFGVAFDATIEPVADFRAPLATITMTNDNSPADDVVDTYDVIAIEEP
jgi:hypothetical protein